MKKKTTTTTKKKTNKENNHILPKQETLVTKRRLNTSPIIILHSFCLYRPGVISSRRAYILRDKTTDK